MDNVSVVRIFILSGLNETKNYGVTLFTFTLLYYCMILIFNISIIVIIILDKNLHEPMYILLCSFCINALYGTIAFYPKFLLDLLSSSQEISYEGCLLQAFVTYSFACCHLSILAVMAYDRYLAICRPLHYHSVMTKRLTQLICFSWITPLCVCSINIWLTSRLKLCGTNIERLYCVNWLIVKLACSDNSTLPNNIAAYITIVVFVIHEFFLIWTYIHIIRTCVRSKDDRVKFMQTCVPHLTSLVTSHTFIKGFDLMYMKFGSTDLPQSLQNFITIEYMLIPPVINPVIYGFKLTKIRNRILGFVYVGRKNTSSI